MSSALYVRNLRTLQERYRRACRESGSQSCSHAERFACWLELSRYCDERAARRREIQRRHDEASPAVFVVKVGGTSRP